MKLTTKNKLILLIAALVVVALALAGLLVYPRFGKIADLDRQIAEVQSRIDSTKVLLGQRQAVKARASQTDAELLRLSNELPESPEVASFIIELQETANESGVDFVALTPSEPVQNTGFASLQLKVGTEGTWADTIDFMQRLARLTRQVRIVGFSVNPMALDQSSGDDVQRVTLETTLEIYTLASAGAAGSSAPPAGQ